MTEAETRPQPATADALAGPQRDWAAQPIGERLRILKRARPLLAAMAGDFAQAIPRDLARTPADTLVSEVLPLLDACRFLERSAAKILAPRRLGLRGLPWWLAGIDSEIHRAPFGRILIIGPANYPLFLPGVQALQAIAAGNAVTWKPGHGGRPVADLFGRAMEQAGLPPEVLQITADTVEAASEALDARPDKVFVTASAAAGRAIGRRLADTATPSVMELSGCDAVVVLPSANLARVVAALAFGMRLNGSATCMAPRRILLVGASEQRRNELIGQLLTALGQVPAVQLAPATRARFDALIEDAVRHGAQVHGRIEPAQHPILITAATPVMQAASADIFAPLLCLVEAADADAAVRINDCCPHALTLSIFSNEREARALAARMTSGTIMINDLMIPTVDPRVPFGGRRGSGFGVTRGIEGLLEMTAPKVVIARRFGTARQYDQTTPAHVPIARGLIALRHAATLGERMRGLRQMIEAARKLNK